MPGLQPQEVAGGGAAPLGAVEDCFLIGRWHVRRDRYPEWYGPAAGIVRGGAACTVDPDAGTLDILMQTDDSSTRSFSIPAHGLAVTDAIGFIYCANGGPGPWRYVSYHRAGEQHVEEIERAGRSPSGPWVPCARGVWTREDPCRREESAGFAASYK